MPKIIVVTGQTATGKTSYALEQAQQIDGELVNCDSRQIYKHLDIVTGKDITSNNYTEIRKIEEHSVGYYYIHSEHSHQAKSWLYDIVEPTQQFSAYDYAIVARQVIQEILGRGKTPIIVGGTYMYLYYLLYVNKNTNISTDPEIRKKLSGKNLQELQQMFLQLDETAFKSLNNSDINNPHRLIRKIEQLQSGLPIKTSLVVPSTSTLPHFLNISDLEIEYIGFRYENKENLYSAIKKRVSKRLEQNAVEELQQLLSKGYSMENPGLNSIGYKDLFEYVSGNITLRQATEKWIQKEMQYAKRQYTFMKKDPHIIWKNIDRLSIY